MIDWSAIQRVHGARFGEVFNVRTVPDAEGNTLFHLLTFWRPERRGQPVVYATWGAPGQDLLLFAVTPYFAFEELLEHAGRRLADRSLAPLDVVTCSGLDTPFRGFLVASPEEGTFSHEEAGAVRWVHRIIVLTPAEVELAERAPGEALDHLRAAGALVADPLRAGRLDPQHTASFQGRLLPAAVRRLRRELAVHDDELAQMRAERVAPAQIEATVAYRAMLDASLVFFQERGPKIPTEIELLAGLEAVPLRARPGRAIETLMKYGADLLEPYTTELTHQGCREFLGLVVASHPEVIGPFHTIVTGEPPPPEWAQPLGFGQQVYLRVVAFAERYAPEHREAMVAGILRGLVEAKRSFDPRGAVPFGRHLWAPVVTAMYEGRHDTSTLEGRAMTRAITQGIQECGALRLASDDRPTFVRLLEVMDRTATSLLFGLAMFDSPEMGTEEN